MTDKEFDRVIRAFLEIESSSENDVRPGAWLSETLGLAMTCVGLGYRDGFWASRYLLQLDTRSPEAMLSWDNRSFSAWIRRNQRLLPPDLRAVSTRKLAPGESPDEQFFAAVARAIDWDDVGTWGPGQPRSSPLLRRAQAMYVLTRVIAEAAGAHAAFSFMIGSNRELFGQSPVTLIGSYGSARFEESLVAADVYLSVTQ